MEVPYNLRNSWTVDGGAEGSVGPSVKCVVWYMKGNIHDKALQADVENMVGLLSSRPVFRIARVIGTCPVLGGSDLLVICDVLRFLRNDLFQSIWCSMLLRWIVHSGRIAG